MMERDGIGNIAETSKYDAANLRAVAFGADGGEGNCPLWDGHIVDAIFLLQYVLFNLSLPVNELGALSWSRSEPSSS